MKRMFQPVWIGLLSVVLTATLASGQTVLNMSRDLVSLGIASANMVPNQPTLDAGPLFVAAVEYAKNHGISSVVADPGTYYFLSLVESNAHFALRSINNMTIDLHGADLIFTHPLYYGLIIYYSTNLTLQNFTIDYNPLPFTQVQVTAVDVANSRLQYVVAPGWQAPSTFNTVQPLPGDPTSQIIAYVFRNGQPAAGTVRMATTLPFSGNVFVVSALTAPATVAAFRPGDTVVLTMNSFATAINTHPCNGCSFRNVSIYSSPNNGIQNGGAQNILMERVYEIPKPGTDRLVSTFGIRPAASLAGPNNQVRLCRAIRTMDDGIAFWTQIVGTIQSQSGKRSLTVAGTGGPSAILEGDSIPNGTSATFQALDGTILGSANIVAQTTPTSSTPPQVTYTFDRDLADNLAGAIMYTNDPNINGANSILERSTVQSQSSCCKAIYVAGLANSAIRGNYLWRSAYSGIFLLQGMTGGDPPAAPLVNLNVSNNVIDGANLVPDWWWFELGAIQTVTLNPSGRLFTNSVLSNINLTNNFIADSGRSAIWVGNTAGGSVTGNYVLNPNARPNVANMDPQYLNNALLPLVIDSTSTGIVTSSNTIDNTSKRTFVTDTLYRELAAYPPGGTIRLNAYNLGTVANPSITFTDADGVTAPVTVQKTAAHSIDVQVPANVGLGGAYLTLTSGSVKYFGTLFIDSQDNIPAVNGCTYEMSLSSTSAPSAAGSLPILVVTQAGCPYQVVDTDSWVSPGAAATGTAVISAGLTANIGPARTTTMEVAGQPFTVIQAMGFSPCDLNQNGIINVADVQLTINQALGVIPAVNDLNSDGFVNVVDVQLEINAALGLGCTAK